jgi:16S rRNA (cytidine1402-2'-O)-methyltransferase
MKIYLIPTIISEETERSTIAPQVLEIISKIDVFFVEDIRTSRRYISKLMKLLPNESRRKIETLSFEVVNKDTPEQVVSGLMKDYGDKDVGVLSESGCPGIADPGSFISKIGHSFGHQVIPLPGPSSIFLALMASGMNGQNFVFHGYLPIEDKLLRQKIEKIESIAERISQTQIFIETPYRNQRLFDHLVKYLNHDTSLCIATDLTGSQENIRTQSIQKWRNSNVQLPKLPTVFLLI